MGHRGFGGSPSSDVGAGSGTSVFIGGVVNIDTGGRGIAGTTVTGGARGVGIDCVFSGGPDVTT